MIDVKRFERILVRVPSDVKRFLDREAERNGSSRNSEFIRSVRKRMDEEQPAKVAG